MQAFYRKDCVFLIVNLYTFYITDIAQLLLLHTIGLHHGHECLDSHLDDDIEGCMFIIFPPAPQLQPHYGLRLIIVCYVKKVKCSIKKQLLE